MQLKYWRHFFDQKGKDSIASKIKTQINLNMANYTILDKIILLTTWVIINTKVERNPKKVVSHRMVMFKNFEVGKDIKYNLTKSLS